MTRWADGSSFLAGPSLERSYSVPVNLPQPGPVCIVVTAATLDVPLATATRRVDAVITTPPMAGPQQVRADVAFSTP